MTAEIAEVRRHVDDLLDDVKSGKAVEIVVGDDTAAELAPMPTHYDIFDDGTIVDQTDAYNRIDELVRQGILSQRPKPLPPEFFTRTRPKIPGLLEDLLRERYGDDYKEEDDAAG